MATKAKTGDDAAIMRGQLAEMAAEIRSMRADIEKLTVGFNAFQGAAVLKFDNILEAVNNSASATKRTGTKPAGAAAGGAAAATKPAIGSIKVNPSDASVIDFPARKQWFMNKCGEGLDDFVAKYGVDADALSAEKKTIITTKKINEGDPKFNSELINALWTLITKDKNSVHNKALHANHASAKAEFAKERLTPADS